MKTTEMAEDGIHRSRGRSGTVCNRRVTAGLSLAGDWTEYRGSLFECRWVCILPDLIVGIRCSWACWYQHHLITGSCHHCCLSDMWFDS